MSGTETIYESGWYDWEHHEGIPFRWMMRRAGLRIETPDEPGPRTLLLEAKYAFPDRPAPRLEVFVDGVKAGEAILTPRYAVLLFPFRAGGRVSVELVLDRDYTVPTDARRLGIMIRRASLLPPEGVTEPLYGAGWYDWERHDMVPYRWTPGRGEIYLPPAGRLGVRYLSIPVFSEFHDFSQVLTLSLDGRVLAEWPLIHRWNYYSVALPETPGERSSSFSRLELAVNKPFPLKHHAVDPRELGARIGAPEFHDDAERHAASAFFLENARLNFEEMTSGETVLRSFPLNLGIDLYGRCNIKPPCVYCLWDSMKVLEGEYVDAVVDEKTLASYGPFFQASRNLVNCSFGEPTMHPRFAEILETIARFRKHLEVSSNGQAITERVIRALVGKPINLYISLDAATGETYSKIRNDRWDGILPSLIRLNEERKKHGDLPELYMVFMPMRVNKGDLEEYFRLCRKIDADALVLRALLYLENPKIERDRGGHHFDYAREMLGRPELEEIIAEAERLSKIYGVRLANQFNFGLYEKPETGEETAP